ncbi:MAG: GDSL-type esterase/lipase family protein [Clostridia bacterium]
MKKVLFIGDSITHDGRFVSFINAYFMLKKTDEYKIFNAGIPGENLTGLVEPYHRFKPRPCAMHRVTAVMEEVKPDLVIVSYGMNDGIYKDFDEEVFTAFKNAMIEFIDKIHEYNAKVVVLTPTPYFLDVAREVEEKHSRNYDKVLEIYSDFIMNDLKNSTEQTVDMRSDMIKRMDERIAEDKDFSIREPIHPDFDGHIIMARTILREVFSADYKDFFNKMKADNYNLFEKIRERDNLNHIKLVEKTGHENPNKFTKLTEEEIDKRILELTTEIN